MTPDQMTPDQAYAELAAWEPPNPEQARLRAHYLAHLTTRGPAALCRDGEGGEHLTASCVVFDPAGGSVLLTHHAKGGFWVQFGGHLEPGDVSLAAAAQRELREESGIPDARLVAEHPVELHRHGLDDVFGSCRAHLDVVFLAVVPAGAVPVVSAESKDVAWFAVDDLPSGIAPDLPARLRDLQQRFTGSSIG